MLKSSAPSPLVVIDCETTGLGRHDRIVEIAAVTLDPRTWELVDEYDTLINPERDVGPTGLHGITASMVEAAPVFSEVAAALSRRLHGSVLIAHNLPFDARMLGYEFGRLGAALNVGSGLCTYRATGEKLVVACDRHGIRLTHQHRALADARATATLAREVLADDRSKGRSVTVGYLPQVPNPRTLRRKTADAGVSDMARIVSLSHYPYSDEALLLYLDALDWVLDDHYIDDEEHAAMKEFAESLGISDAMREEAHRSCLASIIAAAERDGVVTEAEQRLIEQVMHALEISDVALPAVTELPESTSLSVGMHICFTGEAVVDGVSFSRHFLEECAAQAGMQPVGSVTKKGCDLLVAADPSSQSGKARKARGYGIPVVGAAEFLELLLPGTRRPFSTRAQQRCGMRGVQQIRYVGMFTAAPLSRRLRCRRRGMTAAQTESIGERVARLEGAHEHLATKSDVAATRAEIERLRSTLLMAVSGAAGTILTAIAIATAVIIRAVG